MSLFDLDSPINKLKMQFGLTPDLLRALDRTNASVAQLPQTIAAPAGKVKGPSLFDRIGENAMPTPQGLGGLLSDEDLAGARKQGLLSLGASLLGNSGPKTAAQYVSPMAALGQGVQAMQQNYQGNVGNAIATRAAAQQLQNQKQQAEAQGIALEKAKQLPAVRQAIIQKYPLPTDSKPQAMAQWIDTVLPHFIEANDDETVEQLAGLRSKLAPRTEYQQTQTGDSATTFDPTTGKFFDPNANGGKGGWTTSVARKMNPDELALKQAQLAETRSRTAANLSVSQSNALQSQSNAFQSRNKDVIDRASLIKQALTTLRDSQHDPALYTSAVANFIQAADQKAQIRWQLLKYFKENVDPSIGGKWETLKARMLQGKLPQYVSDSMIRHLGKLLAMNTQEYDRRRAGEIKRHPALEGWIPPTEEYFSEGSFGPSSSAPSPTAPVLQRQPGETIDAYMARTAQAQ